MEFFRTWCTIGKMLPRYENMHTREQSVPSFCSRCDPPSLSLTHNILFMSKNPGNTTSVSALIYTINTKGRRIYTHTCKWPCIQHTFYITWKKQSDQYVQIVSKLVNNFFSGRESTWTVFSILILLWMIWMIVGFGVLDSVRGGNTPLRQPKGEKQWEA